MLFNSLSEKHNKATARHHLESIPPPKQLQIFPIVILLHVPSKTLWIKDGHAACSGIQLNHQPWGCDSQTEGKLLLSPLQLLWLSSGFCVGEGRKCLTIPSALLEDPLRSSQTRSCWPNNLFVHGSCFSLFFLSASLSTQVHPSLSQVGQKPRQFCSAWWEADSIHLMWVIPALQHLTVSPHRQGHVRGNEITQKTSLK